MTTNRQRFYKPALTALVVILLTILSFLQSSMNNSRKALGLTRLDPVQNMPPVLAFTTQALGGFRGLIANMLWLRANDLQEEDRYFEAMQLADWITKLEPHYVMVWNYQAWNMVYNISVKFNEPADRWRWVRGGIELLRDEGLRFNPGEVMIYRELAWFFEHKVGMNLDDAHTFYKLAWAKEMNDLFGGARPNFEALIQPKTEPEKETARVLRETYKMDAAVMKEVDEKYGPFEWRMPDAHAIYWAWLGLRRAQGENMLALRRVIYQSMQLAFVRGSLIEDQLASKVVFGPNLDLIDNASRAYEDMITIDKENAEHIKTAHRNFLRNVPYLLYLYNRQTEGNKWLKILKEKYPDLITELQEKYPDLVGPNATLEGYAVAKTMEEVGETSVDKSRAVVGGYLMNYLVHLIQDDDDRAMVYYQLGQRVWQRFQDAIKGQEKRVGLEPYREMRQQLIDRMLDPDPERGIRPDLQARLRSKLGMPVAVPSTNAPAVSGQSPVPAAVPTTNAPAVVPKKN